MAKDYKIGELFRDISDDYLSQHPSCATVRRSLKDISRCRTQQLGGLKIECRDCGEEHVIYASCSNRNCPICPAKKKEEWLLKRKEELLPVKYYHLVFTLPQELNLLCLNHPKLMYNILFRSAWHSVKTMLGDPKWCGAQAGMLGVLHTWGRNLIFHPHLHCIVPAGGLSADGKKWISCRKDSVLVDVKDLSKLYRKTFKKLLLEEWEYNGIPFRGGAAQYEDIDKWRGLFSCFEKDWVVFAKAPSTGPEQTLNYLSRYTHSIAISEGRVLSLTEDSVQLQYKDYQDEDDKGIPKKKTTWLKKMDFIRLFVQHILPSGFHRIRYMGIWSSSNRIKKLQHAQKLLGQQVFRLSLKAIRALLLDQLGVDPKVCPHCSSPNIVTYILSPNGDQTIKLVPNLTNRAPPKQRLPKAS